jgi:TetR/AcrR family transcriptional repressor of nem operon
LDAAELRMRKGGFNGFSFREIAVDVGVKSSSVHYHFPTKENLAAAVVRRYTDEVVEKIDQDSKLDADPAEVWTRRFRETLHSDKRMCPCVVLGAESGDLPPEVAVEVKRFYKTCVDKIASEGVTQSRATEIFSTIAGAMIIANTLGDRSAYDRATLALRQKPESKVSTKTKR